MDERHRPLPGSWLTPLAGTGRRKTKDHVCQDSSYPVYSFAIVGDSVTDLFSHVLDVYWPMRLSCVIRYTRIAADQQCHSLLLTLRFLLQYGRQQCFTLKGSCTSLFKAHPLWGAETPFPAATWSAFSTKQYTTLATRSRITCPNTWELRR